MSPCARYYYYYYYIYWPVRDNVDNLLHFFTLFSENNVDNVLHFYTFEKRYNSLFTLFRNFESIM